jgi:hypothetical protein
LRIALVNHGGRGRTGWCVRRPPRLAGICCTGCWSRP